MPAALPSSAPAPAREQGKPWAARSLGREERSVMKVSSGRDAKTKQHHLSLSGYYFSVNAEPSRARQL